VSANKCRQCGLEILIGVDGLCADCVNLKDKPDGTAERTQLGGIPFKDLKQIDEADRFQVIAGHLRANRGKNVAVMVESTGRNKGKGDRYIAGVKAIVSDVQVERAAGILPGTETLIFKLL